MHFIPCSLCWYQRIFMYPLVFIFLINLLYPDDKVFKYSFPLVIIGLFISIYHNLLILKIIPETLSPCISGVPCSVDYLNYFGFITIPLLSFIAFLTIFILLIAYKRRVS
jgi:disulfide bond formation protein DsbB